MTPIVTPASPLPTMILSELIDRDAYGVGVALTARAEPSTEERPRVQFVDCQLERGLPHLPGSRCVSAGPFCGWQLYLPAGRDRLRRGDLRLAALATFDALVTASDGAMRFELIGVKPVRAFDTMVMMVAAMARDGAESRRVVGASIVEGDAMAAAVRAALHAANRVAALCSGRSPRTVFPSSFAWGRLVRDGRHRGLGRSGITGGAPGL